MGAMFCGCPQSAKELPSSPVSGLRFGTARARGPGVTWSLGATQIRESYGFAGPDPGFRVRAFRDGPGYLLPGMSPQASADSRHGMKSSFSCED